MKRKYGLTPIQRIERRRTVVASGCWETDFIPSKAYPSVKVEGRHQLVHRVAYEAYVGPIPEGLWVLHRCDNPRCHNPEHLFLGDRQANIDDMMAKGRHRVVTPRIIDRAAVCALAHLSQAEIAQRIGCTQSAVSKILREAGLARGRSTSLNKARIGTAHGRAKLTEQDVLEIRSSDKTAAVLAERYGVSRPTIYAARSGTNWKHIQETVLSAGTPIA